MTRKINVNQLISLQYLLEEKHVSRAAIRACVSQPAMSKTLQNLREITGDPLLYRDGNDMKITSYAESILKKLAPALQQLDQVLDKNLFDESASNIEFTIASSDYFSSYALPGMLLDLSIEAPNIKYKILGWDSKKIKELEAGHIDIAATEFLDAPILPSNVEGIKIGEDGLVCMMSQQHELAGKELTMDDYLKYPHICISEINELVDQCLYNVDYKKMIKLSVPYYSTALKLAQNTNHLLTLPLHIAAKMSDLFNMRYTRLPCTSLKINYYILWPKLKQSEDSHIWFRTILLGMMKTDFEIAKAEGLIRLNESENQKAEAENRPSLAKII